MFLPVGADIIIVKLLFNETLDKRTKLFLDFFFHKQFFFSNITKRAIKDTHVSHSPFIKGECKLYYIIIIIFFINDDIQKGILFLLNVNSKPTIAQDTGKNAL